MPSSSDELAVIGEAAAADLLSLHVNHLRRMRRAGRGPAHVQIGERRIGYLRKDIAAWLDAHTVRSEAA